MLSIWQTPPVARARRPLVSLAAALMLACAPALQAGDATPAVVPVQTPAAAPATPPPPPPSPPNIFQFQPLDDEDAAAAKEAQKPAPEPWHHPLPFFADRALAVGADLPLPFGAGFNFLGFSEEMKLNDLVLSVGNGNAAPITFVDLNNAKVKTTTEQAKFDVWVLPFMNVFAFVGNTDSKDSEDFAVPAQALLNYLGRGSECTQPVRPTLCDATVTGSLSQSNNGLNYGVGTLLAGGFNHWFGLAAISYNWTDISGVNNKLDALTISPRLGYQFDLEQRGKVALYTGALYVHSDVRLTGTTSLSTGSLPGFSGDIPATFTVTETNKQAWSYLAGINWDLTPHWTLQAEGNLGSTRSGGITSLTFRF